MNMNLGQDLRIKERLLEKETGRTITVYAEDRAKFLATGRYETLGTDETILLEEKPAPAPRKRGRMKRDS